MSGHSFRSLAVAALLAVACVEPSFAKSWEPVRSDVSGLKSVARVSDIEVRVGSGHLVVSTSQQVQIKVFTILGQMVSSETLPPGVNRLALSHGVYIVKVGDLTCKIAV